MKRASRLASRYLRDDLAMKESRLQAILQKNRPYQPQSNTTRSESSKFPWQTYLRGFVVGAAASTLFWHKNSK